MQKAANPNLEIEGSIFESVWAISYIADVWNLVYAQDDFSSSEDWYSPVSKVYEHVDLKRMAFEKAYFHSLISRIAPTLANTPQQVQEILSALSENWRHYYPWAYSDTDGAIGVSATVIAENIVTKIWEMYQDKNPDIDTFAKQKWENWRVDLLAGIWDELFARLLLHERSEWPKQIRIIAETIHKKWKNWEQWQIS